MPTTHQNNHSTRLSPDFRNFVKPGMPFVVMIFGALIAFEIFNFSTTDLALRDLLGELTFLGFHWSTILTIAFCGIDFAGIARLFTPEHDSDEPKEVWYLFGAWVLAASMNSVLTWWGVSMAVANHHVQSVTIVDPKTITNVVPVFVAVMVWIIRILIIGTLATALERLLYPQPQNQFASNQAHTRKPVAGSQKPAYIPANLRTSNAAQQRTMFPRTPSHAPLPKTGRPLVSHFDREEEDETPSNSRLEPTYHSLTARPAGQNSHNQSRRS